jgi:aconitate hydratase 2/2-methylisocitrate dehydratase
MEDTDRLEAAFKAVINCKRYFREVTLRRNFYQIPEVVKKIKVVTYVAGEGDISTDLLSG